MGESYGLGPTVNIRRPAVLTVIFFDDPVEFLVPER